MPLESGTKLGAYEILAPIGAGGMGEVYRARDPKLERDVAIKILPSEVVTDAERLARFRREAQVLASLNHPNIAAIHGLEEQDGIPFLVLELVEGEDLAERLRRGPLSVDEVLEVALQVAAALEEAHEKGVVHRDLKPANVKLTPEGKVKVLDFGLAKAFAGDDASQELSQSPTITKHQTAAGVVLGTAAYMSPEQARGKGVDKRSDIWSFGIVLYEMLTAQKLYSGETISDTLASILKEEPGWALLPEETPRSLRELLRRCLQKDPRQRLRDIGEARIAIEAGALEPDAPSRPAEAGSHWRVVLPWALAGLLVLVLAGSWQGRERAPQKRAAHVSIELPGEGRLLKPNGPGIAISPDGNLLAFPVGRGDAAQLYLRYLDREDASPIPGTLGASDPFFSPDGRWMGFFRNDRLMKIEVEGGAPIELTESDTFGGSWAADDTIFYTPRYFEGVWRVSAAGGAPERLTEPDTANGELGHWFPHVLPGGKHLLVNIYRTPIGRAQIALLSLETRELRVLIEGGLYARYASSGHIVYVGKDAVMAVPFDASRLELTGLPLPLFSDAFTYIPNGTASLAFSDQGTLVYARTDTVSPDRRLVWVDRKGNVSPVTSGLRRYSHPRLSPDGRNVAVAVAQDGPYNVWLHDLERETQTRLSFGEGNDYNPVWTPDGERVAYTSERDGPYQIYWRVVDGTTPEEPLLEDRVTDKHPYAILPDGLALVYDRSGNEKGRGVWLAPLTSGESPTPLVDSPSRELNAAVSTDGKWLAYQSNESGRDEIYAQPFPSGRRQQISTAGGTHPLWARGGHELFCRNGHEMLVVEVDTADGLRAGRPRVLFEKELEFAETFRNYDISPDGQRFLMVQIPESTGRGRLRIVFNWFEELERRVPSR